MTVNVVMSDTNGEIEQRPQTLDEVMAKCQNLENAFVSSWVPWALMPSFLLYKDQKEVKE